MKEPIMADSDFIGISFIPAKPPTSNVPTMLDTGKSPLEWVDILADRGIQISERTLREKANKLGARIKLGRNMLITVGHMETILKDDSKCRSNRTSVKANGGPRGVSNTTVNQSLAFNDPVLEHLQKLAHGNGATKKKSVSAKTTYSVQKRSQSSR
jgi:hypothetical protein